MNGDLEYIVRPASRWVAKAQHRADQQSPALVLLHDRGADERQLLPLLDTLDPESRLTGVTIRAPLHLSPDSYQWYVVREIGRPDEATFGDTYRRLVSWLDERLPEIAGVGLEQTILGGYSQGGMMAYALSLGRNRPSPMALVVLNGAIPETNGFLEYDFDGHRDMPVAISHGGADPVVPLEYGRSAAERLRAAGLQVTYAENPELGHAIDSDFARRLAGWLARLTATRKRDVA